MYIVEVMPDWLLGPGDNGADVWVPATPEDTSADRSTDSTFEDLNAATSFARSARMCSTLLSISRDGKLHMIRIRDLSPP